MGNDTQGDLAQDEKIGPQINGFFDILGIETVGEKSESQTQVIQRNIANNVREEEDSIVAVVENWVNDAVFTVRDNVIIPRLGIAVISITRSSTHGRNS